jgi:hypothetical protein
VGNRIATIQEDTSATWRLVPSQFNAVDLISSISVGAATCQFTNISSTRYVPFISVPESSGVGRFVCVLGGAFTMAANS